MPVISHDFTVDAKSFLGILSLDIQKPLKLQIDSGKSELDYNRRDKTINF